MNIQEFLRGLMNYANFRHEDFIQSQAQVTEGKLQYQIEYVNQEIITGEISVVHESDEGYYHIMLKKINNKVHREITYRFIITENGLIV